MGQSYVDDAPVIVSGENKPVKFILNDSLLIIPMSCGYMRMDGAVQLYLLNRTKTSIRFAQGKNPITQYPFYMYVDLKRNAIINYYYHEIYDDEANADDGQKGRFLINRYKISNKQFVKTDEVASYYPKFEKVDLDSLPNLIAFYNAIVNKENWKRDRYNPDVYRKIVAINCMADKNRLQVAYDNLGNE